MGPTSKILRAKLKHKKRANGKHKAKCALCSYQHSAPTFCDSRLGLYTVWTALDSFASRFDSGSMVFCLGSHAKNKGFKQVTESDWSVPSRFQSKSALEKQAMRWAYAADMQLGDTLLFKVKTHHAAAAVMEGRLMMRVDMRVALRASTKRYLREMQHLGLSQLCLQVSPVLSQPDNLEEAEVESVDQAAEEEKETVMRPRRRRWCLSRW